MPTRLKHDRSLINPNFPGYRLKNKPLTKITRQLPHDVLTYDLTKMAETSLNRTKLFAQHSPLVFDHSTSDTAYYVDMALYIWRVDLLKVKHNQNAFSQKFNISIHIKEGLIPTNYVSLAFADPMFAVVGVNNRVLLLKTGSRDGDDQWELSLNYVLDDELRLSQFRVSSAVVKGEAIDIALVTTRVEAGMRGSEVIAINFTNESGGWSAGRKKRILGRSIPELVFLDGAAENPGLVVVSSDPHFSLEARNGEEVTEGQPEEQAEQYEQIESLSDGDGMEDVHILRFELESTSLCDEVVRENSRYIGSVGCPPSLCLQCDVDGVVFTHRGGWKHTNTLDALAYIQLGKAARRFTRISTDYAYAAICDSTSNLFVYNKEVPLPENCVLTNRKRREESCTSAELYVASFECGLAVEDMMALPFAVVLLFKDSIVMFLF